jgi:uncharacterized membrane protein HdeD (DUF308 family)
MRNPVRYRAATAIRGLAALLFAIPLLLWAEVDTNGLVVAFAGYALLSAVASLIAAYDGESRALALLSGANLVAGVLFLMGREIDLLSAVYALGAWAMMTGILEIFASATIAAQPSVRWRRVAAGLTMTGLGVFLGLFPELDVASLGRLLGASILLFGLILLAPIDLPRDRRRRGPLAWPARRGA